MSSIKFIKLLLLSSMTCCLQAELIDDLVEIVLHNTRGKQLLKRAIEKDGSIRHEGNDVDGPPTENLPWKKREVKKKTSAIPRSSNQPTFASLNYAHTGWRGGKKEDLESLFQTVTAKDTQRTTKRNEENVNENSIKPPNLPWAAKRAGKNINNETPPNLPWKRTDGKTEGTPPNLPWRKRSGVTNIPWAARDEDVDDIETRKKLYKRLMEDINEYMILKNKMSEKRKTDKDASSNDILSKLIAA